MDIIVGGRLSRSIKEEMDSLISNDVLLYNSTETLQEILVEHKVKAFKRVENIYIYDTGLLNLTDWSSLTLLKDVLGGKLNIYLITRFEEMIPQKILDSEEITIFSYEGSIDMNDVYNRLLLERKEDISIEELLGIGG